MNQSVPVKISFWSAVLMSVNIIVGAGIYFNPGIMTSIAGGYSFLGWGLLGLVLYPVIWSLSQAAQMFPGEGGFYNYCKTGINDSAGFIANWAYVLGYTGTAAVYCVAIKDLLITHAGLTVIADYSVLVNIVIITLFALLNLLKIDVIAKLQSIGAVIKVLPLLFVIAVCAFYWGPHVSFVSSDLASLSYTMPIAIFAYFGFEAGCSLSDMIEGGARQAGRAILTAFFSVMVLYTLFHLGLTYIMGVDNLAKYGPVAFPQFLGFAPGVTSLMQSIVAFFILFSVSNGLYGVSSMNITNVASLAKKNLLFGSTFLSKTNANNRPIMAIVAYSLFLFALVTLIPNMMVLMAFTSVGVCLAFFMTIIALGNTCLRNKDYARLLMSALALVSCTILLYLGWLKIGDDNAARLMNASPMFVGLVVGFVMYKIKANCSIANQIGK